MDMESVFHPNDVLELASHRFRPEVQRYNFGAGKTARLFYAHADEADRLNQISEYLCQKCGTKDSLSFEIDLSELAPRKDGPGVPFGALVDIPVKFTREEFLFTPVSPRTMILAPKSTIRDKTTIPDCSTQPDFLRALTEWSCEFAVGSTATMCKVHGVGANLIKYEVNGVTKLESAFEQPDRDFLFQQLFALNKALEAYIKLNRL